MSRFRAVSSSLRTVILLPCFVAIVGCIRDQVHQPVNTLAPAPSWASEKAKYDLVDRKHPVGDTDHATVEFLEDGRLADPCKAGVAEEGTRPCQLHFAQSFIIQARREAQKEHKSLVVLTFIHGNLNYAGENTDNYPHFRQLIACLNLGQDAYRAKYAEWVSPSGRSRRGVLNCSGFHPNPDVRYIGIFIGWRGLTTLLHLNVRERTALRISKQAFLVRTLYQLRDAAKSSSDPSSHAILDPARFVIYGHSFGGLLLEQSAIRIYFDAYTHPERNVAPCENAGDKSTGLMPFTDMMIAVNPAVYAVQAKKLIEMFQTHPDTFCGDQVIAPSLVRPLLVTFVSKRDFFSEPLGSWFRHTFGGEREYPDIFHFTENVQGDGPSPYLVHVKTPGWLSYFQNLCYITSKTVDTGDTYCNYERDEIYPQSNALAINPDPNVPIERRSVNPAPEDDPLQHVYVRYNCRPLNVGSAPDARGPCGTATPYLDRSALGDWNRTPYWISAIDMNVMNGHNDLWNERFIALLNGLYGAFDSLAAEQVLPNPYEPL